MLGNSGFGKPYAVGNSEYVDMGGLFVIICLNRKYHEWELSVL
jgi:hypothetical protein